VNPVVRLVVIVALVAALFGLGVYADATEQDRWPYPTAETLDGNYGQYVGQETLLFGTVEEIRGESAVIEVEHDSGTFLMEVQNFDATVQPGGAVQVYGTLGADDTIDANRVVVVNPAALSTWYKYGVSAVAASLFLLVFFRYWQVNLDTLQLEARDDG